MKGKQSPTSLVQARPQEEAAGMLIAAMLASESDGNGGIDPHTMLSGEQAQAFRERAATLVIEYCDTVEANCKAVAGNLERACAATRMWREFVGGNGQDHKKPRRVRVAKDVPAETTRRKKREVAPEPSKEAETVSLRDGSKEKEIYLFIKKNRGSSSKNIKTWAHGNEIINPRNESQQVIGSRVSVMLPTMRKKKLIISEKEKGCDTFWKLPDANEQGQNNVPPVRPGRREHAKHRLQKHLREGREEDGEDSECDEESEENGHRDKNPEFKQSADSRSHQPPSRKKQPSSDEEWNRFALLLLRKHNWPLFEELPSLAKQGGVEEFDVSGYAINVVRNELSKAVLRLQDDEKLTISGNDHNVLRPVKAAIGTKKALIEVKRAVLQAIKKNGSATEEQIIKKTGRSQKEVSDAIDDLVRNEKNENRVVMDKSRPGDDVYWMIVSASA